MLTQSIVPGSWSPGRLTAGSPSAARHARMADWLSWYQGREVTDWTIRQLNIQPYQHLLEIGYGSGRLLAETARLLRIGFLAGIESSLPLYQQAYRRTRPFIRRQLVQLHLGELYELPYPAHYFHTIYGSGIHSSWKDAGAECLRLASMLKASGRLVLVSRHRKEQEARVFAERLKESFSAAELTDLHADYQALSTGMILAVRGFKA